MKISAGSDKGKTLHLRDDGAVLRAKLGGSRDRIIYDLEPAYSGGFCFVEGFDYPCIVDIPTLIIEPNLNALLQHEPDQPIGTTEVYKSEDLTELNGSMVVGGTPVAVAIEDTHDTLHWKPSIGVHRIRDENKLFVDAGESVTVNGREFTGPCIVIYGGYLSEMSLVTTPGDVDASAVLRAALGKPQLGKGIEMEFNEWLLGVKQLTVEQFEAMSPEEQASIRSEYDASLNAEGGGDDDLNAEGGEDDDLNAEGGGDDDLNAEGEEDDDLNAEGEEDKPVNAKSGGKKSSKVSAALKEGRRVTAIKTLCGTEHSVVAANAIANGWDIAKTQSYLQASANRRGIKKRMPQGRPGGRAHSDGPRRQHVLTAALARSLGWSAESIGKHFHFGSKQETERVINEAMAPQHSGVMFSHVIKASLKTLNPRTHIGEYATPLQIYMEARRANMAVLQPGGDSIRASLGGFSTISSVEIFNVILQAYLLEAFETEEVVHSEFTKEFVVNDTNEIEQHQLTLVGRLQELEKDGKVKHGTFTSRKYPGSTKLKGLTVTIPMEFYINDNLGALNDLARQLAEITPNSIEYDVFKMLRGMADGTVKDPLDATRDFISADCGNYVADVSYDVDGLGKMRQAFSHFQDDNGMLIKSQPDRVLTGTLLNPTAETVYASANLNYQDKVGDKQIYQGKFRPVESAYLDSYFASIGTGGNDAEFFMFGNPERRYPIKVMKLRGFESPMIESDMTSLDTFGEQWRVIAPYQVQEGMTEAVVYTDGPAGG